MSKNKKNSNKITNISQAIKSLRDALNRIEGEHSNIPYCCIEGYIGGRTYMNVKNSLNEKDQKKLEKWHYVPCSSCFKKNKRNKLKMNGVSDTGEIIFSLLNILSKRKNQDA